MKSLNGVAVAALIAAVGAPAAFAQEAVQWRIEDGGNGHWYRLQPLSQPARWSDARQVAQALGADLASLESVGEPEFVYVIAGNPAGWGSRVGPWLGGFQDTAANDYVEPAGGWRWVSGAPWSFTSWGPGEPNNSPAPENFLHLISNQCPGYPEGRFYNDVRGEFAEFGSCDKMPISAIIEWSADCNGDGIVDYGQILLGELVDANANGIPDTCECIADVNEDGVVNGADISVLLGYWGLSGKNVVGDLTGDGTVNGADLSVLLGSWGPCP